MPARSSPVRRQLEQLLADARARLALHDGQPGDVGRDSFDTILAAQARERAAADPESLTAQVRAIEAAIARVDAGTYGRCVECREQIGAGRLAVMPMASRCLRCQAIAERGW